MKVLVLGGAGYIGSVVTERLRTAGHDVTVFDSVLYENDRRSRPEEGLVQGDIRNEFKLIPEIAATDIIVHLAGLSNDPTADLDPRLTWEINGHANQRIADLCKRFGKRIVFASSCSVYGFTERGIFTESSELNPVSLYAKTKALSESYLLQPDIDSIILRFATAYGYSDKPRFDLVVNIMTASGYFDKKITVNGGAQWRPLVHVADIAQAIELAIEAKKTPHRVYNVGSSEQNFTMQDLGRRIHALLPDSELIERTDNPDTRSYKVNFDRITRELGFRAQHTVEDAVREFVEAFKDGRIPDLSDDAYFRLKHIMNHPDRVQFVRRSAIAW